MTDHFVGIDVGTRSARAGVFDAGGRMLAMAQHDIALHLEAGDVAEQSGNDIWRAVCASVRDAVAGAGISAGSVAGLGFDATCSLVVVGPGGAPLPVGGSGDDERNVIVWMDHRAVDQTARINRTGHAVLNYVGGAISPEMETPKLLWLKENLPATFDAAWQFFDLTDYLTWRATGSLARSICTVTCKWTYLGHEQRWDESYFRQIGLATLADEGFVRIGTEIVDVGTRLAAGLTVGSADDLGLAPGTPVAAGLIDAHAGGVGTVGAGGGLGSLTSRLAYVFGTSACTMTATQEPVFVPGVWGPYYSAMVPGLWLCEGGQSAAGEAIDHLVSMHPAAAQAQATAKTAGRSLPAWLADETVTRATSLSAAALLADGILVVPEFLGNRSPFADPDARAVIAGLGMDTGLTSLVSLYIAGVCGLGYGLRQIVQAQGEQGIAIDTVVICGGAGQHPLIRQLIADSTGMTIVVPKAAEPVLLGSAMLGAVAGGACCDIPAAMRAMSSIDKTVRPAIAETGDIHERGFKAFEMMQTAAREIRRL